MDRYFVISLREGNLPLYYRSGGRDDYPIKATIDALSADPYPVVDDEMRSFLDVVKKEYPEAHIVELTVSLSIRKVD